MANNLIEYKQGDCLFLIRRFEGFEAIRVLGDVQKVLGPIFGGGVKIAAQEGEQVNSGGVISGMLDKMAANLDGESFEKLARLLLRPDYISVSVDGTKDKLRKLTESAVDEVFEGRAVDIISLMLFVVKCNFLNFSKLLSVPTGVQEVFAGLNLAYKET